MSNSNSTNSERGTKHITLSIDKDVLAISSEQSESLGVSMSRHISDVLRKLYVRKGYEIPRTSIVTSNTERARIGGLASGESKRKRAGGGRGNK